MDKDLSGLVMNPVRQRIIQCLALRGAATTTQLLDELADIPKASLYRHIKMLHDGGLLEVAEETKVRGTVERTYRLRQTPIDGTDANESAGVVYGTLMSLVNSFRRYFGSEGCDPIRDRLMVGSSTLMMTDEEFDAFIMSVGQLINDNLANPPAEGRKPRRLTIVSSPCEEEN